MNVLIFPVRRRHWDPPCGEGEQDRPVRTSLSKHSLPQLYHFPTVNAYKNYTDAVQGRFQTDTLPEIV